MTKTEIYKKAILDATTNYEMAPKFYDGLVQRLLKSEFPIPPKEETATFLTSWSSLDSNWKPNSTWEEGLVNAVITGAITLLILAVAKERM